MKKLNTDGLSNFKGLLLLIAVVMVAGTGYFVYHANKKTNTTLNDTAKSQAEPQKVVKKNVPLPTDETKDWTPYTSPKGQFSLRYPTTWVQPEHKELCSPELFDRTVYIGPDKNSVLKCGSEFFGQVSISSVVGDKQADYELGSTYRDTETKPIIINGITGKRISGAAKAPSGDVPFSSPEGTIEVHYVFFAKGNTYSARYTQVPGGNAPSMDVLKEFDLIVTKTLKFSS